MSIIEKLGITLSPWRIGSGSEKDGLFIVGKNIDDQVISGGHNKYEKFGVNENNDAQLIAVAPEMLEALIDDIGKETEYMSNSDIKSDMFKNMYPRLYRKIAIIQKATNKSWEEIKDLL